jgi:hypothetical protein
VEWLKVKALSSNPSIAKKKKRKKERKKRNTYIADSRARALAQ